MDKVDAIVAGAGVIGLAVARELALAGREVLILEAEESLGTGVSSRSSEVIHAGIYYPPGSLKERLCLDGRERLYAFCRDRAVPHRRCGKLVVATSEEERAELSVLARRATELGVENSGLLSPGEARHLEPEISCTAALHILPTGIVDSHALMFALLGEAENAGATLVCRARVESAERRGGGWQVSAGGTRLHAAVLVNAAGLGAQALAGAVDAMPREAIPALHLAKGNYFSYAGSVPFNRLIYPLPEAGGLGTHLTFDLAGQARFGPDVEWIATPDWAVDAGRAPRFLAAVRRFWPGAEAGRLQPAYAGIRPKLCGPSEPAADFVIQGEAEHGLPGLINLFGMESPGLTASLAIAAQVAEKLQG